MKHVLRVVNALAAVVIVVALVVLLCATFTPAGEVPTIGGYGILRTLTGSMEPAIPVHLLVVVQQTDPAELQVGDIITFEATERALDGALNTHRIVQIDEGSVGGPRVSHEGRCERCGGRADGFGRPRDRARGVRVGRPWRNRVAADESAAVLPVDRGAA